MVLSYFIAHSNVRIERELEVKQRMPYKLFSIHDFRIFWDQNLSPPPALDFIHFGHLEGDNIWIYNKC